MVNLIADQSLLITITSTRGVNAMYARFLKFNTDPSRRSEVEALADEAFAIAKKQQGFISIHIVVSSDESEYGSFSLWESKNDAEAGGSAIRSETGVTLQKLASAPPTIDVYEVYKPG
jgi:heme-degrading monooxygenase HmoA